MKSKGGKNASYKFPTLSDMKKCIASEPKVSIIFKKIRPQLKKHKIHLYFVPTKTYIQDEWHKGARFWDYDFYAEYLDQYHKDWWGSKCIIVGLDADIMPEGNPVIRFSTFAECFYNEQHKFI